MIENKQLEMHAMIDDLDDIKTIPQRYTTLSGAIAHFYGESTVHRLKQFKSTASAYNELELKFPRLLKAKKRQSSKKKTAIENEIQNLLDKRLGKAIQKANSLALAKIYLEKKAKEFSSPLVNTPCAENLIPHIPIKSLYDEGKIRGVKYEGKWYFSKTDLLAIATEEKSVINRINQRMKMQHKNNRISLYKIITKIEECRGQLHVMGQDKLIEKIVEKLDGIIHEAYEFRDKL